MNAKYKEMPWRLGKNKFINLKNKVLLYEQILNQFDQHLYYKDLMRFNLHYN